MEHTYAFGLTHYHTWDGIWLMDDFGNAVSAQGMRVDQWVVYIDQA